MKILYVGHTYTVRANQAKIAALARQPGVEITLMTPHAWKGPLYENKSEMFDRSMAPNVTHHILRAIGIGKESAYLFGPKIFRLIARLEPDIIHVEQGAYALVYSQILLALRLMSPRSKALFFTWWNLPYKPRGLKRWTEAFNLANSSGATAGNAAAKVILQDHGFKKPIAVLPQLGIDVPKEVRPQHRHQTFTIGYAGRIAEEKGVLDLVQAVNKMQEPSKRLYFIGNGDASAECQKLAAANGLKFEHHPAVRNDELLPHFAEMDVLVLPSRTTSVWVEQFGHILLEAMAAGVPVIGSSSGEIPHVIGDGGLVFEEGNTGELASALDKLAADESYRQTLANGGIQRVRSNFTHELIAKKQIELYHALLTAPTSSRSFNGELSSAA